MWRIDMRNLILLVFMLSLTTACASKGTTVVLINDPDGKVGQTSVTTKNGEQILTQKNQSTRVRATDTAPDHPSLMSDDEIEKRFGAALQAQPDKPAHFLLYFVSGTTELDTDSQLLLQQVKEHISSYPLVDIRIIGHTDTVGSAESNAELALDRAKGVAQELIASGVGQRLLKVDSHGEGNPFIPTEDNVEEPRNRRVEVVIRH